MEKDLIFFGSEGLTSTSANHIANLAKECVKSTNDRLARICFLDKYMSIVGKDGETCVQYGHNSTMLQRTFDDLNEVADANAFIAWLREAIKARESLLKEIEELELEDYCEQNSIELPIKPSKEKAITREDYIATLSVKERNEILTLGAKAAVFGKYIHEDGKFAKARNEYMEKGNGFAELNERYTDLVVIRYDKTVTQKELDDVFFQLQSEYRKTQAELNAYNHKIDEAVRSDVMAKNSTYNKAYADYQAKVAEITKSFEEFKDKESKRLAGLKIIIPNNLLGIYEKINKLGK